MQALEPALVIDNREQYPKKKRAVDGVSDGAPGAPAAEQDETISLVVQIADDKTISGEAQMAGSDPHVLSVRGLLDEETLRLTLSGEKSAGTLVASRQEAGFDGMLRLSKITEEGLQRPATAYETKLQLSREPTTNTP